MNLRQKYENYLMNAKAGEAYTFEKWKRLQNKRHLRKKSRSRR